MDLLVTVSNASSERILEPLLRACVRKGCDWQVFLTHKGVQVLQGGNLAQLLAAHRERVVACHESWNHYGDGNECPVTKGSQTNHAGMAAKALRVISL